MDKKGFTLIELLAVIVILAIIALIATPIILGIIKDVKEQSNKRSIEMYAKTIEQSTAKYQLNGKKLELTSLKVIEESKGRKFENTDFEVDYDGNVVCDTIVVFKDGNIYIDNCKVNGQDVKYSYGKKVSFANDSWETILANIKSGYMYNVGDTKEVALTGFENQEKENETTYTVRIANNTTPSECNTEGFSQTACGFVIEFEDIIIKHNMNSTSTNVGGWEVSEMRKFVTPVKHENTQEIIDNSGIIYNALPEELKQMIIETKVVSGPSNPSKEANIITQDKIYLLSPKEVWGDNNDILIVNDPSRDKTRQLDYYLEKKITPFNPLDASKNYNVNAAAWWLRSAYYSYNTENFYEVWVSGSPEYGDSTNISGVAPAFRIG